MEQTVMGSPNIQTLTGVIASCAPSSYSTLPPAIRYVIESGSSSDNAEINALKQRVLILENNLLDLQAEMLNKASESEVTSLNSSLNALTNRVTALENSSINGNASLINLYNGNLVTSSQIVLDNSWRDCTYILCLAKSVGEANTAAAFYDYEDINNEDEIVISIGVGSLIYSYVSGDSFLLSSNTSGIANGTLRIIGIKF